MRKRNSREKIAHVLVLRVIAFGEACIEMLHESLNHGIGSWVVGSCRDLLDAEISDHGRNDASNEFGCFVVAERERNSLLKYWTSKKCPSNVVLFSIGQKPTSCFSSTHVYGNKDFALFVAVEVDAVGLTWHGEVFDIGLPKIGRKVLPSNLVF